MFLLSRQLEKPFLSCRTSNKQMCGHFRFLLFFLKSGENKLASRGSSFSCHNSCRIVLYSARVSGAGWPKDHTTHHETWWACCASRRHKQSPSAFKQCLYLSDPGPFWSLDHAQAQGAWAWVRGLPRGSHGLQPSQEPPQHCMLGPSPWCISPALLPFPGDLPPKCLGEAGKEAL